MNRRTFLKSLFTRDEPHNESRFSLSDRNEKENLQIIMEPLAKNYLLDGVSFSWRGKGDNDLGVIAQDVEQIFPELVRSKQGLKSVNYNGLVALHVEALKETRDWLLKHDEQIQEIFDRCCDASDDDNDDVNDDTDTDKNEQDFGFLQ